MKDLVIIVLLLTATIFGIRINQLKFYAEANSYKAELLEAMFEYQDCAEEIISIYYAKDPNYYLDVLCETDDYLQYEIAYEKIDSLLLLEL